MIPNQSANLRTTPRTTPLATRAASCRPPTTLHTPRSPHGFVQWRYTTAHMCLPPGVDVAYAKRTYMPWPTFCGSNYLDPDVLNPEKFWWGRCA